MVSFTRIGLTRSPRETASVTIATPALEAHGLVLLPDGDTCALGAENDGEVYLVSLSEGRVTGSLDGHRGPVNSLAPADDGRLLLTGSDDGTVGVWDAATRRLVDRLVGHDGYIRQVAAAGTTAVSVGEDRAVMFWDLSTGTRRAVFHEHGSSVDAVAVSADGLRAVTASRDNDVLLWDLTGPHLDRALYRAGQKIVDLSGTGFGDTYLAAGRNDTGRGHGSAPRGLAFDAAGRIYTAADEVICWDPDSGEELYRFPWHQRATRRLAVHPAAGLIAAIGPAAARICDLAGTTLGTWLAKETRGVGQILAGGGGPFTEATFTADGRLVTLEADGTVRLWPAHHAQDADAGGDAGHASDISTIVVDPTSRYAASVGQDQDVMVWDLATGARTALVPAVDPLNPLAFTPDGEALLLIPGIDRLLVQPTAGGEARVLAEEGEDWLHIVGVTPLDNDTVLISQFESGPQVWRLDGGERRALEAEAEIQGSDEPAAATLDGRYVLLPVTVQQAHPMLAPLLEKPDAGIDVFGVPALRCWDLGTGQVHWSRLDEVPTSHSWPSHHWVRRLDAGSVLVPTADDRLVVLDVATNTVRVRIDRPDGTAPLRRHDGTLIFVQRSAEATDLWSLSPGDDQTRPIVRLPAGRLAIAAEADVALVWAGSTARAHDLGTGAELASVDLPVRVSEAAISPDGRTAVIGDDDGTVHLFRVR
jgi:WD40 repeat protein